MVSIHKKRKRFVGVRMPKKKEIMQEIGSHNGDRLLILIIN